MKYVLVAKIVVYNGSITSWDSNHLPHDSHSDVLPTTLRMPFSYQRVKMIYIGYGDHRGRTGHALFLLFSC